MLENIVTFEIALVGICDIYVEKSLKKFMLGLTSKKQYPFIFLHI